DAAAKGKTHDDLVALYKEFRAWTVPVYHDGVPDYTPAAMKVKGDGIQKLLARLAATDTTGWPIADRVDYMVVKAEMNGMAFDHRVFRPWSRDRAFYAVIGYHCGPKRDGAMRLPPPPLAAGQADTVRAKLRAVPGILTQARSNLTEPTADL